MRTLGLYALSLQVQGAAPPPDAAARHDILSLVAESSLLAKLVLLLILILFSVVSWGIILYKLWSLGRAERQSAAFLDVFRKSSKFSEVQAVCKNLNDEPAGRGVPGRLRRAQHAACARRRPAGRRPAPARVRRSRASPALDRALLRAATVEVNRLEERMSFLATTASITPYIGLFGTVWGIMSAFSGHRRHRLDQPRRRRAGHRRSADCDGGGTVRGDSGRVLLQPPDERG